MRTPTKGGLVRIFLPLLLVAAVLLTRADLHLQRQQEQQLERLARAVAWEARAVTAGLEEFDLVELNYYPEVREVLIVDGEGQALFEFHSSPGELSEAGLLSFREEIPDSAGYVQLRAQPLGWPSLERELPVVALALLGLSWLLACWKTDTPRVASDPAPGSSEPSASSKAVSPGSTPWVQGRSEPSVEEQPSTPNDPYRTGAYRHLVLELDKDLIVKTVSQGARSYGLDPDELLGRPIGSFLNRFETESNSGSTALFGSGGEALDSVFSSTPIRNQQGELEKVIVTVQDSLDEQQLMAERFAKLQQLFESICEHASESILLISPGRRTVYANPSFGKLVGKGLDACVGHEFLDLLEPETRVAAADALHRALDANESTPLEFALSSPLGRRAMVGAFYPVRRKGGAPRSALGIFRDVTEERELAEELRRTEEQYRHTQKVEALGRLAGGVAHDFNNLLTTISMNHSFLAEKLDLGQLKEAQACLDELAYATGRASELTQQLLLFSRKSPPTAQKVSAHETVRKLLSMAARLLGSDIDLRTDLKAKSDSIYIDPGQLEQVLMNLVINARDAMPDGGRLEISSTNLKLTRQNLTGLKAGEYLVVKVRDRGEGIPTELLGKVLEPYFTTKEIGKGTGLGLPTVVAIVEKARGHLSIQSQLGEGTEVSILLPICTEAPIETSVEISDPPQTSEPNRAASESVGERILLVEDEKSVRRAVQLLLEKRGFQVTTAEDGLTGQRILEERGTDFDLLLTDLVLPGCSGSELAVQFLKRNGDGKPVLFMSGYPADTLDNRELLTRCRFLAKPFSPEQLFYDIEELLGAAR